jgi:hypothetical protein
VGASLLNGTRYDAKAIHGLARSLWQGVSEFSSSSWFEAMTPSGLTVDTLTPEREKELLANRPFRSPQGTIFSRNPLLVVYTESGGTSTKCGIYLVLPEELFESDLEQLNGLVRGRMPTAVLEKMAFLLVREHPLYPSHFLRGLLSAQPEDWGRQYGLHEDWRSPSRVPASVSTDLTKRWVESRLATELPNLSITFSEG